MTHQLQGIRLLLQTKMVQKKLLVLDVNGLLLDTYFHKQPLPNDSPDGKVGNFFVYRRPFCGEFIQFCLENFVVGVWSSAREYNVNSLVDFVFGEYKQDLAFCWHQSDCTDVGLKSPDNKFKPLFLKELSKLWTKVKSDLPWDKGDYGPGNTLLVDDTPYKAILNPPNTGIFPQTYTVQNEKDDFLGCALRKYLERIRDASNVQEFVQSNPIGEPSITSASPLWSYVEQIMERVNEVAVEVGEDVSQAMQFDRPNEESSDQWHHKEKRDLSTSLQVFDFNFPSEAVELEYTMQTPEGSVDDNNLRGCLHEKREQHEMSNACSIVANQWPDAKRTCLRDEELLESRNLPHCDNAESRGAAQDDYQFRAIVQKTLDNGDAASFEGVQKKKKDNQREYINDCDLRPENEVSERLLCEVHVDHSEWRNKKIEAEEPQLTSVMKTVEGLQSQRGECSDTSSKRMASETVSRGSQDRNIDWEDKQDKKHRSEQNKERECCDWRHEKEVTRRPQSVGHSEWRNQKEEAQGLHTSVVKTVERLGSENGEHAGTSGDRMALETVSRYSEDRNIDWNDRLKKKHRSGRNKETEYLNDCDLRHEKEVSERRERVLVELSEWRNEEKEGEELLVSSAVKTLEGLESEDGESARTSGDQLASGVVSRYSEDRNRDRKDRQHKKHRSEQEKQRKMRREYHNDHDLRHEKEVSERLRSEVNAEHCRWRNQTEDAEELRVSSVEKTVEGLMSEKRIYSGTSGYRVESETVSRYSQDRNIDWNDRRPKRHRSEWNMEREYLNDRDFRRTKEVSERQQSEFRREHFEQRNKRQEAEELQVLSAVKTAGISRDRMASETISRYSEYRNSDWRDRQYKKHESEWNKRREYLTDHDLRHEKKVSQRLRSEVKVEHSEWRNEKEETEELEISSIVKIVERVGSEESEHPGTSGDKMASETVSKFSKDRDIDRRDRLHMLHMLHKEHGSERDKQRMYLNDRDLRHEKEMMSERLQSEFQVEYSERRYTKEEAEELQELKTLKWLGSGKGEIAESSRDRMASKTVSRYFKDRNRDRMDREYKKDSYEWKNRRW